LREIVPKNNKPDPKSKKPTGPAVIHTAWSNWTPTALLPLTVPGAKLQTARALIEQSALLAVRVKLSFGSLLEQLKLEELVHAIELVPEVSAKAYMLPPVFARLIDEQL
jgi:hypothetical protein